MNIIKLQFKASCYGLQSFELLRGFEFIRRCCLAQILILLACVQALTQSSTTGPKTSLLILECDFPIKCQKQVIKRIDFLNGVIVGQEVLLTLDKDIASLYPGTFDILDNRYIVARGTGSIFDIVERELFSEQLGWYLGVREGKILIDVAEPRKNPPAGNSRVIMGPWHLIYEFDPITRKYEQLESPNFYTGPIKSLSPDLNHGVVFEGNSHRLLLFKRNNSATDFSSVWLKGKYKATGGKEYRSSPESPFVWVDNDSFVTQRENGKLVIYNVKNRQFVDVDPFPVPKDLKETPRLEMDNDGNIVYHAGISMFRIDLKTHKASPLTEVGLGNGFTVPYRSNETLPSYRFMGTEIGSTSSFGTTTVPGYLADQYYENINTRRPMGVRVWNKFTKKWMVINLGKPTKLIGWVISE